MHDNGLFLKNIVQCIVLNAERKVNFKNKILPYSAKNNNNKILRARYTTSLQLQV